MLWCAAFAAVDMSSSQAAGDEGELLNLAIAGDSQAISQLLSLHRQRLKSMVRLRLSPQLQSRVDESDILQEAFIDAARKLKDYAANPQLPFYLWLRNLAGLKLLEAHRRHTGTDKRDATREISIHGGCPEASSVLLAGHLCAGISSPSQQAMKNELRIEIHQALETMDAVDREVLVLRHFEQLSTAETAQVLGLSKSAAGSRYLRALDRLRDFLVNPS